MMKAILLFISIHFSFVNFAQPETPYRVTENDPEWVQYMYSSDPNVYLLRELYEGYYADHDFIKTNHTQYYKRLLKHYWTDLDDTGRIKFSSVNPTVVKSPTSAWEELGPWDYDHEQAMAFEVQSPGAAHVYTVEQSPIDPNTVYAGTATAGLWKSVDKGQNWVLVTQDLIVNGVYSIILDSTDIDIVYFGERNGQIWKSTDGGVTWNQTGDASFQSTTHWTRDLRQIGLNTLLAATEDGLFRSVDGGTNWNLVNAGEHMEIELKPDDSNIIYTVKLSGSKTQFYKSTDNGISWTLKDIGWPNPAVGDEQKRCEIAVTPAAPNLIYIVAAGAVGVDEGLYGTYRSSDAGETFSFDCCGTGPGGTATPGNPNILGYSEDGSASGGQYYYDLAIGIDPDNANKIFASGIDVWRSENGGATWEINAHWVTWVSALTKQRYTHADVHDIKFFKHAGGTDMWVASDGGLYYSSSLGDTMEPRMHGIHGTDFWGYGQGFKNGYVMVGGTYHNGTLIRYNDIYKGGLSNPDNGGWLAELAGDNYRGFVNYADSTIGYADNGSFTFSDVREVRMTSSSFDGNYKCNTSYVTGEYGTYGFSPFCYKEIYSPVGTVLYKSVNGGATFIPVHDFGGSKVLQVKTSWANPNVIYLTHKYNGTVFKIWKTLDGGVTWTDVTGNLLNTTSQGNKVKYIELDEKDENKLWCILMGTQSGNKVFQSNDGGNTWFDLTTATIDNENVISIAHQYGTDDGIYIGTKQKVYYRNAGMSDWALFNNNLPASTAVSFIEPFYSERKIRAASQRGVYQCDFYETSTPVAMASADTRNLNLSSTCSADTVQFYDHSTVERNSATWSWSFEGGIPSSSTEENPVVLYDTPGTYGVTLIVNDQFGTDTIIIADFITVVDSLGSLPNIWEDFNGNMFPPAGWKLFDSNGISWEQDWPEGDNTDRVASYPNYWVDATGQTHLLIMPSVDLTDGSFLSLSFDYAYNNNNNSFFDTLAVLYRTGTNPEWQTVWVKGGADLEATGTETYWWYYENPNLFFASAYIELDFLNTESCVELAFSNIGNYGNHIWIDNVNLFGEFIGLDKIQSHFATVFPNPSNGEFRIQSSQYLNKIRVINITGDEVYAEENVGNQHTINLQKHAEGLYIAELISATGKQSIKLIKK